MKKGMVLFMLGSLLCMSGCSSRIGNQNDISNERSDLSKNESIEKLEENNMSTIQGKVLVGDQELKAEFYDNATTQALLRDFPLTIMMMDLYSREMCYRFDEALPANEAETSGYEVGDIAYWPPRHSFVIFYKQNNEVISDLQKVGRITSGVEVFEKNGDIEVTFETTE